MKIEFQEIKHPLFFAIKGDGQTIWWEDSDDDIHYFDDIPANYPRWVIGTFDNKQKAIIRAKEMENEGWEIIENRTEE